MKTLHNYDATAGDSETPAKFSIEMPRGAQVVNVYNRSGEPEILAIIDTDAPLEKRSFAWRGTDSPIDGLGRYIGTVPSTDNVRRVYHLFETT